MFIELALYFFITITIGLLSSLFLFLINAASIYFSNHHNLIWGLPFFGLVTIAIYQRHGHKAKSTSHIIRSMHLKDVRYHGWGAPMVILFSSLSQLFGASTGREGAAVQFGAAIADSFFSYAKKVSQIKSQIELINKENVIRLGIAAGFSGVCGLPLTGAIFANEITKPAKPFASLLLCLFSSYLSYQICVWLESPHTHFVAPQNIDVNWQYILALLLLGILMGALALLFNKTYHFLENIFHKKNPYLIVSLCTLAILIGSEFILQNYRFNGLGLNLVGESLTNENQLQISDWFYKFTYTILSITSGLKGGEFVPMMALGAVLANLVGGIFAVPAAAFAPIGVVSFFSTAIAIPFTAGFAGFELFNWQIGLASFVCTVIGTRIVRKNKLYPGEV